MGEGSWSLMKITKIETIPIRLPTRRVHQWASLTTPIGVYVIVKLYTDEGLIGLGEAPVLKDWGGDHGKYFGETPQTTAHIINDILAPALSGQDWNICVDANQVYPTAKAAVKITKAVEEYNLLYREQPVEGIDQMAEVARRVDTPIMADESAWTAQDVIEIIQKKAADVISIYTTKPGGMFKAKKVAAVAEAAGMKCNVNGSVETGVGNAANIHLAASTGVVTYGCVVPVSTPKGKGKGGIAGIYYQDDVITEAFEYADGDVIVSSKPGLGIELDEDKIKHYRID